MSFLNKQFKNNQTGEVVKILDVYENVAITDKKTKLNTLQLSDNRYWSEFIDPKNFFNDSATYESFREKIKNIDLSKVPTDDNNSNCIYIQSSGPGFLTPTNDSAIIYSDPEDEKRELMKKYNIPDNSELEKQRAAFSRLLNEEEDLPPVQEVLVERVVKTEQPNTYQASPPSFERPRFEEKFEDPIISIFRKVKRVSDFKLTLDISDKLPRPDFIEMMEDSYETSIIDFLADDILSKVLKDPSNLKSRIIEEIKRTLVKTNVKKSKVKKTVPKKVTKNETVDIERETKPEATKPERKIRVKKITTNNDQQTISE